MNQFLRDGEQFTSLFNAVGLWINKAIDQANAKRNKEVIAGATKRAQSRRFLFDPTLEISVGEHRKCFVSLRMSASVIDAEIDDVESGGPIGKSIRFRLENDSTGPKAFLIDSSDPRPKENEIGPQQIAEMVVAGALRGHFD